MNLIRQIKTVLWSLIGLGRRADMADIHQRGSPLVLIPIAFVFVAILVGTLVFIAHSVVKAA